MAVEEIDRAALEQRCPRCKAEPGQECSGRPPYRMHLARKDKAVKAMEREERAAPRLIGTIENRS